MFKNEDSLRIHLKYICNKPPRFKCGYCEYKAPRISNVKIHSSNIHKDSPLNIIELYKTAAEFASFVCPNENCEKKYKIKYDLNKHLKYECGKAPCFKCFYCDFQNSFIGRINTHCRLKHPDQEIRYLATNAYNFERTPRTFGSADWILLSAQKLQESFQNREKFEKTPTEQLPAAPRYHCGYCDYKSPRLSSVKNHASQKHGGMKTNILSITQLTAKITPKLSAGTYQCPNENCKKRYKTAADCRAHIKYECGKPPRFKCFGVPAERAGKWNLQLDPGRSTNFPHSINTASGIRYVCTNANCKSMFKNKCDRNVHSRYYCNKPPRFMCTHCGYRTLKKDTIKQHTRSKHSGMELSFVELYNPTVVKRNYVCPEPTCGKRYKSRAILSTHLKYECGKPARYMCAYCDFKNCIKSRVRSHCSRAHPDRDFQCVDLLPETIKNDF
ncbi:hypothetical protein G9C98_007952 [Cotesia typhae]|uniref:C2H2-type domain-containing protein n=1 Tax=Cotesia typhae TaxID=2053667 RepID=A0A8J5UWR5_9HYME|nr:hypothetical protein G9C98_007952 [Cotesia typhae]